MYPTKEGNIRLPKTFFFVVIYISCDDLIDNVSQSVMEARNLHFFVVFVYFLYTKRRQQSQKSVGRFRIQVFLPESSEHQRLK